ncbi:MAG TPA: hypothetical protein DDZ80_30465 [Cyanobacteria bacterium UBA8803]|nr:hypothetical protein [Cyanobacteria bacterium UBA9273]HBL62554.1 hypothetical protein [Cyanobacteria bacterium UBA8803]
MTQNKSGKFNFTGVGLVGLLALVILGGGALLLNQNSPTFNVKGGDGGKVGDVRTGDVKLGDINGGEGGKGGNSSITDVSGSGTNQQGDGNQSYQASSSTQKVDITATNVAWTLTFPGYNLEKDKCTVQGKNSVNLTQNKGSLEFGGVTTGYRGTSISGTITPAGQVNLSLTADNPVFVTFEGANPQNDSNLNATVITGKVTAPNCPNDTFQLSKGN